MPTFEIVKRHGETYIFQGRVCIAVATAEGEQAVEELVGISQRVTESETLAGALGFVLDKGFESGGDWWIGKIPASEEQQLRDLVGANPGKWTPAEDPS